MKRDGYEAVCTDSASGTTRFVEHRESREIGEVLACHADGFEVDVFGKREFWPRQACEEKKNVSTSVSG